MAKRTRFLFKKLLEIKAIQELKQEIQDLKNEIDIIKERSNIGELKNVNGSVIIRLG